MKRVLLVDDQASIRKAGKQILEKKGFEVYLADNGEMGLSFFRNQYFDLIILDYYMPKMNGMQVLEKIRSSSDTTKALTPIMILSTEDDPDTIQRFMANGANVFLQKKRLGTTPEIFLEKALSLSGRHEEAIPYRKAKLNKTVPDVIKKFHIYTNRVIQGYLASGSVEMEEVEKSITYILGQIEDGELYSLVYDLVNPDDYLVTHTVNCSLLTMMFCRCYLHWSREKVIRSTIGAFFHDFGYLDKERLLFSSPSTLSKEDFNYYLGHVERSIKVAEKIGLHPESIDYIAGHHERKDGSGFPSKKNVSTFGDAGEVAAIINSFDSLTFANDFHGKIQAHEAIRKMKAWENNFSDKFINHFASFTRQFDFKPQD